MEKLLFELTNHQRTYLGLLPVEDHWELVQQHGMHVYFDGEIIRKKIVCDDNGYYECELAEHTAENRTLLLPKTSRGKSKKLNYTATLSFKPFGVYFRFSGRHLYLSNYTTQRSFYSCDFEESKDFNQLQAWLTDWIKDTDVQDLKAIQEFANAKRINVKYKEGDFFTYKIGRRQWGFGRILIDIATRNKVENLKTKKHYGLLNLMGKGLIVKVYGKISEDPNIDINTLPCCLALPPQAMMDNQIFYGEHTIIGNLPLQLTDYDEPLISYSRSISGLDKNTVYLQYGMIFRETDIKNYDQYLSLEHEDGQIRNNPYRNEGIGFGLYVSELEACIAANSLQPYWEKALPYDLRNPNSAHIKQAIFNQFGLDATKSYAENLIALDKD